MEDIDGRPTSVGSVTEVLTEILLINAKMPSPMTWSALSDPPLRDGLYFNDYITQAGDSLDGSGTSIILQRFIATVGNTTYALTSSNLIITSRSPGGPIGTIGIANANPNP